MPPRIELTGCADGAGGHAAPVAPGSCPYNACGGGGITGCCNGGCCICGGNAATGAVPCSMASKEGEIGAGGGTTGAVGCCMKEGSRGAACGEVIVEPQPGHGPDTPAI